MRGRSVFGRPASVDDPGAPSARSRRARSPVVAVGVAALLTLAAGCVVREQPITHLKVQASFEAQLGLDQLRFSAFDGTRELFSPPKVLPAQVGGPLESGQTVAILVAETEVGRPVTVRVVGMKGGADVVRGEADGVPVSGRGVELLVVLNKSAVTSVAITPVDPVVPLGGTLQLGLVAHLADGGQLDLGGAAIWSGSDATVATVGAQGGVAHGLKLGQVQVTANAMGLRASATLTVGNAALVSLSLSPQNPQVAIGLTRGLTATGAFTDGSTQNLTEGVTWSSIDPNVASVSDVSGTKGVVSGHTPGFTTITARMGAIAAMTTVFVTSATLIDIAVTPTAPRLAPASARQLFATGIYSDGSSLDITSAVTWASSQPSVATVGMTMGVKGLVSAIGPGVSTVTATLGTVFGSTEVTVSSATLTSISVTPTNPTLARGTDRQLVAVATYSDATTQDVTGSATWTSGDPGVATVGDTGAGKGLVHALATGTATISARVGVTSGSATVTVTSATLQTIAVTPTKPSVPRGGALQMTATGTYSDSTNQDLTSVVTWTSSAPAVATVNAAGQLAALTAGTTTITATAPVGAVTGATLVTVSAATLKSLMITPPQPSLAAGTSLRLTATGIYSDNTSQDVTTQVTWTSSAPAVATVSNSAGTEGELTALKAGSATLGASLAGVNASTNATVTSAMLTSIAVSPTAPLIARGTSLRLSATGSYSDGTTQDLTALCTWTSSSPAVATISNASGSEGLASSLTDGATTITATLGLIAGSTTLTVSAATLDSIAITPDGATVGAGTRLRLVATGTYSDASTQDLTTTVTWASSSSGVATISNASGTEGEALGIAAGTTTISATLGAIQGTTSLAVSAATLQSIAITPANFSLAVGTTRQYVATGTFSDASTQILTTQVTWSTGNSAIATINSGMAPGRLTAVAAGTTTVQATLGTVVGTTSVTVTAATLTSIAVMPNMAMVAKGGTQQYTATGNFSTGGMQDVTTQVTWTSSNTAVATVSNALGSQGLVTAVSVNTATITATLGTVAGNATVSVVAPALKALVVTPVGASLQVSQTLAYTATGIYTDNSTVDLTQSVNWTTADTAVATITKTGTRGVATGVAAGSTTVTAKLMNLTGSTSLTVTP